MRDSQEAKQTESRFYHSSEFLAASGGWTERLVTAHYKFS